MQETQETWVQSLDWEDLLVEEMATQSNILAWQIPPTEEPGRLRSVESQSQTPLSTHTHDVLGTALGAWDSGKEKQTKTCPKAEVVISSQCILWFPRCVTGWFFTYALV